MKLKNVLSYNVRRTFMKNTGKSFGWTGGRLFNDVGLKIVVSNKHGLKLEVYVP